MKTQYFFAVSKKIDAFLFLLDVRVSNEESDFLVSIFLFVSIRVYSCTCLFCVSISCSFLFYSCLFVSISHVYFVSIFGRTYCMITRLIVVIVAVVVAWLVVSVTGNMRQLFQSLCAPSGRI